MAALLLPLLMPLAAPAAPRLEDVDAIPQLSPLGRGSYQQFLDMAPNRAFVIAPGGTWAWRAELPSEDAALDAALADCQQATDQRCVPYAVNHHVVFDALTWPTLWGPYVSRAELQRMPVGPRRGQRFPDLALRAPDGRPMRLSDLRGQVVILHFWGSWCPPCQREFPDLQRLHDAIRKEPQIRLVLLPVRETLAQARSWAEGMRVRLPIYDTGLKDESEEYLKLADGSRLADREIASKFPTTYVLDRHGVVIFRHVGAATRWLDYLPFLKDAAVKSGR